MRFGCVTPEARLALDTLSGDLPCGPDPLAWLQNAFDRGLMFEDTLRWLVAEIGLASQPGQLARGRKRAGCCARRQRCAVVKGGE